MPYLVIKSNFLDRIKRGYPWVFNANMASPLSLPPGEVVTLVDNSQTPLAKAFYNPLTSLACRILTFDPHATIDVAFFKARLEHALEKRKRFFNAPYYRLIHAESDNMPGLIIDRFHSTFVCQTNTAGMERLKPLWLEALIQLFNPERIIFKDDAPLRQKEGLTLNVTAPRGTLEEPLTILENDFHYFGDPLSQKTGWFYDHRANRHWIAARAQQRTMLDLYTFQGGFGLLAAAKGAAQVTLVDSSEAALKQTQETAEYHHLQQCTFIKKECFALLEEYIAQKQIFDIVVADPPAFVKQARHQGAGLRGYQKLARLASQVVAPNGILLLASCSHHASAADFRQAVETGMNKSGRNFQLLRKAGADRDHPVHPMLPETHYLKSFIYAIV